MELPSNFLSYHSEPRSMLDLAGRLIFEYPTKLAVGDSKPSFDWTWNKQPMPKGFIGKFINGDRNASTPKNYLEMLISLSRFGWQTIRVLEVDEKLITPDRLNSLRYWKYAYAPDDRSFLDVCSTSIKPNAKIKILNGPVPFWVIGLGNDNKEVPLTVSNALYRGSKNYKGIPLF
ncbi:MAG: hypothetical protein WCV81_02770 [Microgenomates group bacterium]|jgi:hypothetical protein